MGPEIKQWGFNKEIMGPQQDVHILYCNLYTRAFLTVFCLSEFGVTVYSTINKNIQDKNNDFIKYVMKSE